MLGDALLDQFLTTPPARNIFRMGQYSPVSIRDQVVRATYLVDRLLATRQLTPSTRLLVIGAGAAGVTAAMHASKCGVSQVELVESKPRALSVQAGSRRQVCPTQYDWPAEHWGDEHWPLTEGPPRSFTAVSLSPPTTLRKRAAARWATSFGNLLTARPGIKTVFDTEVDTWRTTAANDFEVDFVAPTTPPAIGPRPVIGTTKADLIIIATGFGDERTTIPLTTSSSSTFEGVKFWNDDKFEEFDFGMSGPDRRVLVSGSGDGALQDFCRLITGMPTVAEIWKQITASKSNWWTIKLEAAWHWEDHARRAAQFAPHHLKAWQLLMRLHTRYTEIVNELVISAEWANVVSRLDAYVIHSGPAGESRPLNSVWLAVMGEHFESCYPLNRVVVLVLLAYIRHKAAGHEPLLLKTALKSTTSAHAGKCAQGCWGKSHEVLLAQNVVNGTKPSEIANWKDTRPETYEGLVIRHGIQPAVVNGTAPPIIFQNLPLHLP